MSRSALVSRASLACLAVAVVLLGACTSDVERTLAAEALQQGPQVDPKTTFHDSLVRPPARCTRPETLAAMTSTDASRRAAGALCAAKVPCDDIDLNGLLLNLVEDRAVAAEYVNRGPMFGSGDQTVRLTVADYAARAAGDRRLRCPAG